jgi:hypothetical protein
MNIYKQWTIASIADSNVFNVVFPFRKNNRKNPAVKLYDCINFQLMILKIKAKVS